MRKWENGVNIKRNVFDLCNIRLVQEGGVCGKKHLYCGASKRQLVHKSDEMVQNLDNELDLMFEMRQVPIS